ncbi:MAG TPA: hypothetical protein V6C86_03610 [Oculatellaceae cyanobacterium]
MKGVQSLGFVRIAQDKLQSFEVLQEKIFVAKASDSPINHLYEAALLTAIRDCEKLSVDAFRFVLSGPSAPAEMTNDLLLTLIAHQRFEDICSLIEDFPWFYSEFRKGPLPGAKFAKLKAVQLETQPTVKLPGLVTASHLFTESGDLGLAILAAGQAMQLAQKLDTQGTSLGFDFFEQSTSTYGDACFKYAKTLQDLGRNVSFKYATPDYNKRLLRLALNAYEQCKKFECIESERICNAKAACYALLEQNFLAYFEQVRTFLTTLKSLGTRKALAALRSANHDDFKSIGTDLDEFVLLDLLRNRGFKEIFDLLKNDPVVLDFFQCYRHSYWTKEHLNTRVDEHLVLLESIFANENPLLTFEDFDSFVDAWATMFSEGSFGLAVLAAGEGLRRVELLVSRADHCGTEDRQAIAKLNVRSRFLFASALRDFGSVSPLKMKVKPFQRQILKLAVEEYSKALRLNSRTTKDHPSFQLSELADCYSCLGRYLTAAFIRFKLDYWVELTLLFCLSKKVCLLTLLGAQLGLILNFPGTFLLSADPVLPYYFHLQNALLSVSLFPLLYFPELPRHRHISQILFKIGTALLSAMMFFVVAIVLMRANVFAALLGFLVPFTAASFVLVMAINAEQRIDRELGLEPSKGS